MATASRASTPPPRNSPSGNCRRAPRPHGLVVDEAGIVWYTGNGNGTIGRLDPKSDKVTEYKVPGGGDPHTIVIDANGKLWFTIQNGQRVGRLDRASGRIDEYPMSGNPYGLAIDRDGIVWVCRLAGDALGWIDPVSGKTGSVATGAGSLPRRIATAPDGSLWVAYYGNGLLAKLDPKAKRIVKTWALPKAGGERAYAVTADAAGRIWINGVDSETVSVFDPVRRRSSASSPCRRRTSASARPSLTAAGRYWYMGSHNGRLGVVR
jgi:virginiamycin B lyase